MSSEHYVGCKLKASSAEIPSKEFGNRRGCPKQIFFFFNFELCFHSSLITVSAFRVCAHWRTENEKTVETT